MKTSPRTKSRPRAIQASRHLHVVHRQHTGHVLPRRHTSYPTLLMIVLCAGVLLASWTRWVTADPTYGPASGSYDVHVSVPGPAPSQAATIETVNDLPVTGPLTVKSVPITVAGNCPVNTYEKLFRNNVFSGVVLCSATGSYSLQSDLFVGLNHLQVQDFSLTDVPGPLSNTVDVTYAPPTPPAPATTGSPAARTPTTVPLLIKTQFVFQGYYSGESTPWSLDVEGGTPPYAVEATWGDGQTSLLSRPLAGSFNLSHTYAKAGGYKGSYPVLITVSDARGQQSWLQLLAIINNSPQAAAHTQPPTLGFLSTTPDSLKHVLAYIWPSYLLVLLMLTSFWLGERRELHVLKPQLKRAGQRH